MSRQNSREGPMRSSHVAELLQVSPKTISRWARERGLPHTETSIGGHRRFKRDEVLAWVEQNREIMLEERSARGQHVNAWRKPDGAGRVAP